MNQAMKESLDRLLLGIESHRRPPPPVDCPKCDDTGWQLVDEGLEDGRRVSNPVSRRCDCDAIRLPAVVEMPSEPRTFR